MIDRLSSGGFGGFGGYTPKNKRYTQPAEDKMDGLLQARQLARRLQAKHQKQAQNQSLAQSAAKGAVMGSDMTQEAIQGQRKPKTDPFLSTLLGAGAQANPYGLAAIVALKAINAHNQARYQDKVNQYRERVARQGRMSNALGNLSRLGSNLRL